MIYFFAMEAKKKKEGKKGREKESIGETYRIEMEIYHGEVNRFRGMKKRRLKVPLDTLVAQA